METKQKELTAREEDDMLEVSRERDTESRGENNGYDDWFSDNRTDLMSDFIENHLTPTTDKDWRDYCKEQFERWKEDKA